IVTPGRNSATNPNRTAKAPRSATAHQFCARSALMADERGSASPPQAAPLEETEEGVGDEGVGSMTASSRSAVMWDQPKPWARVPLGRGLSARRAPPRRT